MYYVESGVPVVINTELKSSSPEFIATGPKNRTNISLHYQYIMCAQLIVQ